jgi:hypothetical protein
LQSDENLQFNVNQLLDRGLSDRTNNLNGWDLRIPRRNDMVMNQANLAANQLRRAVGVFRSRQDAEYALFELRDSGFPMERVSVIAQDGDRPATIAGTEATGNKADEGATVGAVSGGALGGLTGLLIGLGALAIPGIGPIMLAGAGATVLATTLAGGAIGAATGGLVGGLIGLGIPEERARRYHDRVAQGDYLVMVEGSDAEIARAATILHRRGVEDYGVYDLPAGTVATAATPVGGTTPDASADISRSKHAIGFFTSERDAEAAINNLRRAGFPLRQVSLVGQNFEHRNLFTGVDLRDRLDAMRLGLPTDRARFYHDRVAQGEYVVIVHGTAAEVEQAEALLTNHPPQQWGIFDSSVVNSQPENSPLVNSAPTASSASNDRPLTHNPTPQVTIVDRRVDQVNDQH